MFGLFNGVVIIIRLQVLALLLSFASSSLAEVPVPAPTPPWDYELELVIEPDTGHLQVSATITPGDGRNGFEFLLNSALRITPGAGVRGLETLGTVVAAVPMTRYRLQGTQGAGPVTIHYSGAIAHQVTDHGEGFGRGFASTPGLIAASGVYLSASTAWFPIPVATPSLYRFRLSVDLPVGWDAVSQGRAGERDRDGARVRVSWREDQPQDDIYLVAAPWTRYRQGTGVEWRDGTVGPGAGPKSATGAEIEALAFLRSPDPTLAERYLAATGRYLDLYSRLLGPYPYAKFALVENFWESGYGMPSFTLLGSTVLRLPFILHTSYPHEILHNWWGNGVYVNYAGGNWSEGLTAYLSDHLFKAMRAKGADYRRDAMQRYRDFVARGRDFPLTEFRGRHGPVSQAVGYGKALMVFHMLRRELGDRVFIQGLRRFYRQQRFRFGSWGDIQTAMEAVSGRDLGRFFAQWLRRTGAPHLVLTGVRAGRDDGHWRLTGELSQDQSAAVYGLRVPVLVQMRGTEALHRQVLTLSGRRLRFSMDLPAQPLRLMVDPGFDVFRLPDAREVPPALSGLFGSPRPLVVLSATAAGQEGWRAMVAGWAARGGQWQVVVDSELQALPADRSVLLLGWDNRFVDQLPSPLSETVVGAATVMGQPVSRARDALVLVGTHPGNGERQLAWIGVDDADVLPILARKLPHYGKYGYLVFRGGRIHLKGQWPVFDSPLWVTLPGGDAAPPPILPVDPPLTALIDGPDDHLSR